MFRICQLASGVSARACHAAQARVNMMISCQSNIRNPSSWLSAQRPLSCSRAPICQAAKSSERPTPGNDPRLSSTEQSMADTDPKLKVVELKDADVEGVAKVDSEDWQSDAGRVRLLVAGDAAALLVFAIAGQSNHAGLINMDVLAIAMPFWISWYSAGFLTNAYGKEAQDGNVGPAALAAAKTWAIAAPLGLVFRSILKGYAAPVPFIIVAMSVTGFLTIGWRSALAALTKPYDQLTPLEKFQRQKSKKGNAAEFMGLLQSLTKRW